MNKNPSVVVLSLQNCSNKKFSGILLQKKVILTHAAIIAEYFSGNDIDPNQKTQIAKHLKKFKPILPKTDDDYKFLEKLKFFATIQDRDKNLFETDNFQLHGIFNIEALHWEFKRIFAKVEIADKPNNLDVLNEKLFKQLTSSFIVLTLGSSLSIDFSKILQNIRVLSRRLEKLDKIFTVTAPFGFDNFFNTINSGKISNIFGNNQSGFIISTALPHGAEGCPVFSEHQELMGIVVCTGIYFSNDNMDFTLAANIFQVFQEISNQLGVEYKVTFTHNRIEATNHLHKSSVLVSTKHSHGSGCLVEIKSKKYILTCSHVIHSAKTNQDLVCVYKGGKFRPINILYRNKIYGAPYDIAILEAPDYIPLENFTKCARYQPFQHLKVYSSAFPIFSTFDDTFNPSLYGGRVTRYINGVLFTDIPVQAGQSGGPVLDDNGQIVGISVQNIKNNNRVYPKLNMAIPIYDILLYLEEFSLTDNDATVLDKNLKMSGTIADVWLLNESKHKHKL